MAEEGGGAAELEPTLPLILLTSTTDDGRDGALGSCPPTKSRRPSQASSAKASLCSCEGVDAETAAAVAAVVAAVANENVGTEREEELKEETTPAPPRATAEATCRRNAGVRARPLARFTTTASLSSLDSAALCLACAVASPARGQEATTSSGTEVVVFDADV